MTIPITECRAETERKARERAKAIIFELDEIARETDVYQFGLPLDVDSMERFIEIVLARQPISRDILI